jgi:hypothetical protein
MKRTGPEGACGTCGLPIGSKVSVMVFGGSGGPISRKIVVTSGKSGIEIKLDQAMPPMPVMPGRKPGFVPPNKGPDPDNQPPRRPRRDRPFMKN